MKVSALALLIAGISSNVMAVSITPEIDPGMGINALALLGGLVLVVRSARRK